MKKIYSAKPSIEKTDISFALQAIKYGWNEKRSDFLKRLSVEFSSFVNVKYSLPLDHGTSAIHLGLIALGIKKGDEVIVPDFTWAASASPITYVGAKPVFCDVETDSMCLSLEKLKRCLTSKTKAIIVVDLYGGSPEWSKIVNFCRKKKIKIIEDAAESLGAYYKNNPIGSFGDISIFSFQATKLLSSGMGGMLCTNNKKLYEKCLLYHHHGMSGKANKFYWSDVIGFNYQITNLQASIVLSQLRRVNKLLKKKKEIFLEYKKNLKDYNKINFANYNIKNVKHSYWMTIIFLKSNLGLNKDKFMKISKKYNIEFRPVFYPLTSMPAFKKFKNSKNKNSYSLSEYGICLPSGNDMNKKKIIYVTKILKKIIDENS